MLALDFDGVVCDSVEEAWQSSKACAREHGLPAAPDTPLARERFRRLRPLITEGADFLLIQRTLNKSGSPADDIAAFHELRGGVSADEYAGYRELLAAFRRARIRADFSAWVSDHSLYRGIPELLSLLREDERMIIVSTKQADLISAILSHFSLPLPEHRIHYAGTRAKLTLIQSLASARGLPPGTVLFVDDQPEHFRHDRNGMLCRLADWGYLPPDWNADSDPPLISREELSAVARSLA